VEEEQVETNFSIHDGGKLLVEQCPDIHHSRKLQVAEKHEGVQGYQGHVGARKEASRSRLDYPLSNPIEKSNLEELV
jgi:hypothetical protein